MSYFGRIDLLAIMFFRFLPILTVSLSVAAAPFRNLDFEMANTNNMVFEGSGGFGTVSDLLPGWKLKYGTNEATGTGINSLPLEPSGAGLLTPAGAIDYASHILVIGTSVFTGDGVMGKYAFAAAVSFGEPVVLSQIGEIPEGARFLILDASLSLGTQVEVRLDGQPIPNGDVHSFVGKTVNLEVILTNAKDQAYVVGVNSIAFDSLPPLRYRRDIWNPTMLLWWPSIPTNIVLKATSGFEGVPVWCDVPNSGVAAGWGQRQFGNAAFVGTNAFYRLALPR